MNVYHFSCSRFIVWKIQGRIHGTSLFNHDLEKTFLGARNVIQPCKLLSGQTIPKTECPALHVALQDEQNHCPIQNTIVQKPDGYACPPQDQTTDHVTLTTIPSERGAKVLKAVGERPTLSGALAVKKSTIAAVTFFPPARKGLLAFNGTPKI
jgi:hypothetical protein